MVYLCLKIIVAIQTLFLVYFFGVFSKKIKKQIRNQKNLELE